jgi:hypothetical protein
VTTDRNRPKRLQAIVPALAVLTLLALPWVAVRASAAGQTDAETARALAGAIDIHVHSLPDDRPRSIDAIDVARLASQRGIVGGSLATPDAPARLDRFAEAIRSIGPESCILSSDLGQAGNAVPPDGFGEFLVALRARGFSEQEMDRMAKQNPARLLGLP